MTSDIPHITRTEFIRRAINDKEINFIAFVVTPWHVISLDASLMFLQSMGSALKGMVLISPHINTGINVAVDSFSGSNYELYIETSMNSNAAEGKKIENKIWRKIKDFFNRRIWHIQYYLYIIFGGINWKRKPIMYIISQTNPETVLGMRMRKYKHAKFVINDEGIGSYTSYFHMPAPIGDEWKGFRVWMHYFREEILGRQWVCIFHNAIHTTIFKNGKLPLVPRYSIIPYYNQIFSGLATKENVNLTNAILIAPSVYIEEREIYHGEDLRIWKDICEALHEEGYKLYMKPHPRDNFFVSMAKDWHCEVINKNGLSMEGLCAKSKPKCVIGGPSTALVTSALFFNVPSICIVDMMNQDLLSQGHKDAVAEFKAMFNNLVQHVNSIDDLIQRIKVYGQQ